MICKISSTISQTLFVAVCLTAYAKIPVFAGISCAYADNQKTIDFTRTIYTLPFSSEGS